MMKKTFEIGINNQKQVIKTTFIVPEKCRRITIKKIVNATLGKDFRNKIDIAFFDETGKWYGRFDRYKNSFIIDESSSIDSIPSGEWQMFLEVFQAYEEMKITLEINFDCYEDYNLYKGELHTHTNITDGKLSFKELKDSLSEKGHDFFFISDHNSITAWEDLAGCDTPKGYKGLELTTFYGHILLLGINNFVSWYDFDGELKSVQAIRDAVKEKGGLMGIAHPFSFGAPFCAGCRWEKEIKPELFDFIEVWNSKQSDYKINWEALNLWIDFIRKGHKIFCTCGGDIHRNGDLENALYMSVLATSNKESKISDAIRKGRTYLSKDKTQLRVTIAGKTFGQTVKSKDEVVIDYDITNTQTVSESFLITKKGIKSLGKLQDSYKLKNLEDSDFVILMGKGKDNSLEFLTNPIFIQRIDRVVNRYQKS